MNDSFGEVVPALPGYVCYPLERVIGDTIFLMAERPEVAGSCPRLTRAERRLTARKTLFT
jgi:hypothetical protein